MTGFYDPPQCPPGTSEADAETEAWEAYCADHAIDYDDDEAFDAWRADQ